jgi:hypothetical protein
MHCVYKNEMFFALYLAKIREFAHKLEITENSRLQFQWDTMYLRTSMISSAQL